MIPSNAVDAFLRNSFVILHVSNVVIAKLRAAFDRASAFWTNRSRQKSHAHFRKTWATVLMVLSIRNRHHSLIK